MIQVPPLLCTEASQRQCKPKPITSPGYNLETFIPCIFLTLTSQGHQDALPELGCPTLPGQLEGSYARIQNSMPRHKRSRSAFQLLCSTNDTDQFAESPFLHSRAYSDIHYPFDTQSMTQLPVLTSFIPSLLQHEPFRVSIHNWEKPKSSRLMESLVGPEDAILFEGRVYVDGVLVTWADTFQTLLTTLIV